jgi:hypothetical protein
MAPKRKRTLAGPLPSCAIAGLLVVSAPAARIARRCAEFVVRTQGVALLRLARTAELGPVVHALVAMLHRQRGGGDGAVDHGHCALRQGITVKGSTGGDGGRIRENASHELRIGNRRCRAGPLIHTAGTHDRAVGYDHIETSTCEGAGRIEGPDFENPGISRESGEGQSRARERRLRVESVDTRPCCPMRGAHCWVRTRRGSR